MHNTKMNGKTHVNNLKFSFLEWHSISNKTLWQIETETIKEG